MFSNERLRNGGPHPGYVDVAAAASFKGSVGIPQKNGKPDVPSRTRHRPTCSFQAIVTLQKSRCFASLPLPNPHTAGPLILEEGADYVLLVKPLHTPPHLLPYPPPPSAPMIMPREPVKWVKEEQ